jgi:tRNA pseudouridine38-40 synthase
MARYKITLAYDGTLFQGFQRQKRKTVDARTVQGVFELALHQIGWTGRSILAAGRTDSGVHASGQVVAFDLDWRHSLDALQAALNAGLPEDVSVRAVDMAADDFHPRYSAVSRRYRYTIYCQPNRDPLRDRYAWRVWPALDLELLQRFAGELHGTHDFADFGTPPRSNGSTIRSIFKAEWSAGNGSLIFEVTGNAFLYRMVRRLVYFQVAVAQGKLDVQAISDRLYGTKRQMVQGLAPAQGLVLVEVSYL